MKARKIIVPALEKRHSPAMDRDPQTKERARSAAEEILRVIYGDDLEGCTVSLDRITEVILTALTEHAQKDQAISELHEKAFEAIQLLSTPPANGEALGADELRSLLGERLDKIQSLSSKVIAATKAERELQTFSDPAAESSDTAPA
ncbi:MAG TPA: hypothetical protein VK581_08460 [Chthoniobacterales bacterium]|nr:hypothetical protein [Chthoniobacterales bacterium]